MEALGEVIDGRYVEQQSLFDNRHRGAEDRCPERRLPLLIAWCATPTLGHAGSATQPTPPGRQASLRESDVQDTGRPRCTAKPALLR